MGRAEIFGPSLWFSPITREQSGSGPTKSPAMMLRLWGSDPGLCCSTHSLRHSQLLKVSVRRDSFGFLAMYDLGAVRFRPETKKPSVETRNPEWCRFSPPGGATDQSPGRNPKIGGETWKLASLYSVWLKVWIFTSWEIWQWRWTRETKQKSNSWDFNVTKCGAIGGRNITLPKQLKTFQVSLRHFLETTKIFELKNSKILLKKSPEFWNKSQNFSRKKNLETSGFQKSNTFNFWTFSEFEKSQTC